MLGNALAWLCLAVFVTPGWFAVRGWHAGRGEPSSQPLADWLPLALAISVAWSGALVLTGGVAGAATIAIGGPPAVRVDAFLVLLTMLWLVPFGSGWASGRWTRKRHHGWVATLVLKSGATVTGTVHHTTATDLELADVTVDERRHDLLTVNRSDVELLLRSGCDTAEVEPSRSSDGEPRPAPRTPRSCDSWTSSARRSSHRRRQTACGNPRCGADPSGRTVRAMARALAVPAAAVMLAVPAAAAADTVKIDFETPPAPPVWQSDGTGLGSVVNGEYLTSAFTGFLATYRARDTTRVSAPMTCSIMRRLRRQSTGQASALSVHGDWGRGVVALASGFAAGAGRAGRHDR